MNRITVDPKVMGGVPCLRGLRIPVATVANMMAGGLSVQEIVDELPPLEADDVAAVLRFAADAVSDRELLLLAARENRVIVSGDTDFGTLLAMSQGTSPSVILFRSRNALRTRILLRDSRLSDDCSPCAGRT